MPLLCRPRTQPPAQLRSPLPPMPPIGGTLDNEDEQEQETA